jgi:hypothetical protein
LDDLRLDLPREWGRVEVLPPAINRPQKITFAEMRASGVRALLIYCSDYRFSHSAEMTADEWPDDVRLSDVEPRFICSICGRRGADVRPHPDWGK